MKVGIPKHVSDQAGPKRCALDSERVLESKPEGKSNRQEHNNDLPLKDDPEFSKYIKFIRIGVPQEVVAYAMRQDGKDPRVLDLNPGKSLSSQLPVGKDDWKSDDPPLKDDPEYARYFRLRAIGVPLGPIKRTLQLCGKDPRVIDLNPEKSLQSQIVDEIGKEDGGDPALKDDPEFAKYFQMLKMKLPIGAVKHALQSDGKDPSILDLDPSKSLKRQRKKEPAGDDPPLKDVPEYTKYFKMLKMGLPKEAVKHAMQRDGYDASILDLDYDKSIASQQKSRKRKKLSSRESKSICRKQSVRKPINSAHRGNSPTSRKISAQTDKPKRLSAGSLCESTRGDPKDRARLRVAAAAAAAVARRLREKDATAVQEKSLSVVPSHIVVDGKTRSCNSTLPASSELSSPPKPVQRVSCPRKESEVHVQEQQDEDDDKDSVTSNHSGFGYVEVCYPCLKDEEQDTLDGGETTSSSPRISTCVSWSTIEGTFDDSIEYDFCD